LGRPGVRARTTGLTRKRIEVIAAMRTYRNHSRKIAVVVMGLLVVSASATLWAQDDDEPPPPPNIYENLPPQRLIETLRYYGMNELLATYLNEVEQGPEVLMGMAGQPDVPLAERNSLLDRAIAQLTEQIEQASPGNFSTTFETYQARYLRAQALIQRAEPYLRRGRGIREPDCAD
jgi:hypothetical protein